MKLATVTINNQDTVVEVNSSAQTVTVLNDGAGKPVQDIHVLLTQSISELELLDKGATYTFDKVKFRSPIPQPKRNILCVGKNYREHAKEFTSSGFDSSASSLADAIPNHPIVFTKFPETVIGPNDPIRYPHGASEQLDYEAELGVIIGRTGTNIDKADAMNFVFGFTIINDMTARDRQAAHKQWFLGKSLDTFCPMGPWIATQDDFDLETANVRCWVNDELRQDACTADLIFDVPTLIATISQGITLKVGDVIATGTPAGVGIGYKPPKFLAVGDKVAIEIDGLGHLENTIE